MCLKYAVIILLCYAKYSVELPDGGPLYNTRNLINPLHNPNSKISEKCKEHLNEYEAGLRKGRMWALEMLDASAKFPSSGILRGNLVNLGDFDLCLNASNNNEIFGKYCLGALPLPGQGKSVLRDLATPETRMISPDGKMSSMFAVCLPDACSAEDFQKYYTDGPIKLNFFEDLCTSKSSIPPLSGGDIATISFLGVVLYVMLMSTVYEAINYYLKKKPVHPVLTAFSVITNTKKLLQTTNDPGHISCLHGIRVLSMVWVIIGHRFSIYSMMPMVNLTSFGEWLLSLKNMVIMGATASVDTFFLLGGLLVSYGFLLATSKGFKFNIFIYYFHRFLRLTPLLSVIILMHVTIIKHLGSGPLWNFMTSGMFQICEKYWWSTLLYIQNIVNPDGMCIPHTWYLSADTQLFLLSPLVLLPLKYSPKLGISLTGILIVCSIAACFVVGWIDEVYGFIMANMLADPEKLQEYMSHYYFQPHTRAGPWLMGIILGYIIFEIKQKNKTISINPVLSILLWITSLVILCACVFTGQNMLEDTYVYDRFANALYLALLRPGWALGVAWVIFACIIGHGGPVNWFLSLPMFQVVSKVTYSMYLIHMTMLIIVSAQTRVALHFSNLELFYIFWGDFAFTFGAAVLFTLAFESPIIAIERVIFGKKERRSPDRENVVDQADRIAKIQIP